MRPDGASTGFRRAAPLGARAVGCCAVCLGVAAAAWGASGGTPGTIDELSADELVAHYNRAVTAARAGIRRLTVQQTMIEPDGDERREAVATLTYTVEGGMTRQEHSSTIGYPRGEYTLESLTGPLLEAGEYDVVFAGTDTVGGEPAHRLEVTALERDDRHFDGELWISAGDHGPVRVRGTVADPPFPVLEITLDKSFEPVGGVRLVTRHTGEVEAHLLVRRARGVRHIFYEHYEVDFWPEVTPPRGKR